MKSLKIGPTLQTMTGPAIKYNICHTELKMYDCNIVVSLKIINNNNVLPSMRSLEVLRPSIVIVLSPGSPRSFMLTSLCINLCMG